MAGEGGFEFFPVDSPFSPRHEAPFVIQGKTFSYVLQYVLYRKAERFNDKDAAFSILETRDLKVIERCGTNVRNVVPRIWNTERIQWAELALEEKFTQNAVLKEQLFATFPKTLAYATTKDKFWSIGLSINRKTLSIKDFGERNVYGVVLTRIRDKLMKKEDRLREDGQGQHKRVGVQVGQRRQGGEGDSHGVEGQVDGDERRQEDGLNSHGVEGQAGPDERGQGGERNSHGVDGDERRQDSGLNSQMIEGQAGRGERRHGGGKNVRRQSGRGNSHWEDGQIGRDRRRRGGRGNSHAVERGARRPENWQSDGRNSYGIEAQVGRDGGRLGGGGNSHWVEGHADREERWQGGGGNSHWVEGQATRDERREWGAGNSQRIEGKAGLEERKEGGGGNSYGVEGQENWGERRENAGRNSHGLEVQTNWDERWHGGAGNNNLEGRVSWDRMNQNWRLESQMTEVQASGDYNVHGREGKNQGIEEHASEENTRQDSKGMDGHTILGSNKKGGKRKSQRAEDPRAPEDYGGEGEKRHKGLAEQHVTGEVYKDSDRMWDWQTIAGEMPQWDETDLTSRHKRKMTYEQTQRDWNTHGNRNQRPRHSKGFYTEMPNQDKFVLFFGNQSPFSQHHPAKFVIKGTEFNCAEQYMMYQKTVIFENKEMEQKIMGTSNPVEQKRYGRQIPEFKFEVWKKHFIDVVERATEAKFTQNPHLQEPLFGTYPKLLVEASPSDRLWGIGRSQKDPLAWDRETWRGKNQLGYIITRVRDRLMEKEDTHWAEWEKWKDDKRWEVMEEEEKMKKRRWDQSNFTSGNTKEWTPKTRRESDRVRDDGVTQKDDSSMYQSRRESYKHVSGKENFEFFGGIKSPFSQYYPTSFTVDGRTFTSAEQYTVYQMAVIFEDQECQKNIMSTNDPQKLEDYSYEIQNFQWEVWEPKCLHIVERGITAKFSQNSNLKEQLFATHPKLLAECNHEDLFWSIGYGLGYAKSKSKAWNTKTWRGENVLGYTLTKVRDRLMEKEKAQKEVGVGDVNPQGTAAGEEDATLILGTMKEASVDGDDKQDVKTMEDENTAVNVEIQKHVKDVEEDESSPHFEQNVMENWDDEMEEVTLTECEVSENIDTESMSGEGEKRRKSLVEQHMTGEEYKEPDRKSDWQSVTDEMPYWDETYQTSRPKRRLTDEQTQHDWKKHKWRNMEPRNTKRFYPEMPNQDKFVLFFGNQSPFSQHHPVKFVIDGIEFNCAEQYMMYQKTVIFENKEMEQKIMGTSNPVEQKRYGRQIPEFKFEVWKKHFIDVVERATEAKFSQNPHLQEPLFGTYPKLLVEASPSDRLWGIGRSQKDPLAWDRETWRGKNQLGYIITRVRDRLMKKEDTHWAEWEKWKDDKRWEVMEEEEKMKKRRRWDQSNFTSGNTKEWTPKTRRESDRMRDDGVTQKEDSSMYQSRRESYKHVSGKENFKYFGGIKSPFSQYYPASFEVDGRTFACAEQYTLYQMAVIVGDRELQESIISTTDHNKLKRYSRQVQNVNWSAWRQKSVQVVESSVIEKFSQNSNLKEKLFATYPKLLAMSENRERFWGIGIDFGRTNTNSDAWDTECWSGRNMLGYILTTVRDGLMEKEKRNKELDAEDVRLQGTIGGEEIKDGKTILMEDRTMNKTVVDGEDAEIVVLTSGDEERVVRMEVQTDEDVEEDESGLFGEQHVRENGDDEIEDVTSTECEESDKKDIHTVSDKLHLGARYTEEEDVASQNNTELGEENVVELQKMEKNYGEKLGKMQKVNTTEDVMSVPDTSKEDVEGGGTIQESAENESNSTMLEVKTTEDITSMPDAPKKDVEGGGTIQESAENESNSTMLEVKTTEDITSMPDAPKKDVEGGGTIQESAENESNSTMLEVKTTEDITSMPDAPKKDVEGGGTIQESAENESNSTMLEVKTTEDITSMPDAPKKDVEGGGTIQESAENESNSTMLEVKTTEDITSMPDAPKKDVEGGGTIQESAENESNSSMLEVKTTEDITSMPDAPKKDVEGGGTIQESAENESNSTMLEVKTTEDITSMPDAPKKDVEGGGTIQESAENESNSTMLEVKTTEDITSMPDAPKKDVEGGGTIQESAENESNSTMLEVKTTEDITSMPDAPKKDVEGGGTIQESAENESNSTMLEVKTTEDITSMPDAPKKDVEGGGTIQESAENESNSTMLEVKTTEDITSMPDAPKKDVEGGGTIQESAENESNSTMLEVKTTEDITSMPDAPKKDVEGGGTIQESVENESNSTMLEVKTTEDITSMPDAPKKDVEGGGTIQESAENESNSTMLEVKTTEDITSMPDAPKKDVEGGGTIQESAENESNSTMLEVKTTEDITSMPDAPKKDVEGGGTIQESAENESNSTMLEVKTTEDITSMPDAPKKDVEGGGTKQESAENESNSTMLEVKITEDITSMPDAPKKDVEGGGTIQESAENESNSTMLEVKTTEDVASVPDNSKEDVEGGRTIQKNDKKQVIKREYDNVEKELSPAGEEFVAEIDGDKWQEDVRTVSLKQEEMRDSKTSAAVEDNPTSETQGEEVVMEGGEAGEDEMEQGETNKVTPEQAPVVAHDRNSQAEEVKEGKDAPEGEVTDIAAAGEAEIVMTKEVEGQLQ